MMDRRIDEEEIVARLTRLRDLADELIAEINPAGLAKYCGYCGSGRLMHRKDGVYLCLVCDMTSAELERLKASRGTAVPRPVASYPTECPDCGSGNIVKQLDGKYHCVPCDRSFTHVEL